MPICVLKYSLAVIIISLVHTGSSLTLTSSKREWLLQKLAKLLMESSNYSRFHPWLARVQELVEPNWTNEFSVHHSKGWVPSSWCFTDDLNSPTAALLMLSFFGMFQFQSLTWHLPAPPTVAPRPTVSEVNLLFNWHFGLFSGFWRANLRLIRDLLRHYIDAPRSHSPGTI